MKTDRLLPLILTQAFSAFNNNQLRSALLILVTFRGLSTFGLSTETTIGLSTIAIVAPFFLLSIPAGRIADHFPKVYVLRACKAFEVLIFSVAALGFYLEAGWLLLLSLLLAGIEAAMMGPAKFGIIPELVAPSRLMSANAWMSATNTAAILLGMISGNLLALNGTGLLLIATAGVVMAAIGLAMSLMVPVTAAKAPDLTLTAREIGRDFLAALTWMRRIPGITAPILGISWFWFQGAVNTALIPLYVKQSPAQPESLAATFLIVTAVGVASGALLAKHLATRFSSPVVPVAVLLAMILPAVDILLMGTMSDGMAAVRVLAGFFIMSVASGFYVVPLAASLQALPAAAERARLIGLGNTISGLAMIISGSAVILAFKLDMTVAEVFMASATGTGLVAFVSLTGTLPFLRRHITEQQ